MATPPKKKTQTTKTKAEETPAILPEKKAKSTASTEKPAVPSRAKAKKAETPVEKPAKKPRSVAKKEEPIQETPKPKRTTKAKTATPPEPEKVTSKSSSAATPEKATKTPKPKTPKKPKVAEPARVCDGGFFAFPSSTDGRGFILWRDQATGFIVGQRIVSPWEAFEDILVASLRDAITTPLAGEKTQPKILKVADHRLAEMLRRDVGDNFAIQQGETTELEAISKHIGQQLSPREEDEVYSYFQDGRVSPASLKNFFQSAKKLYNIRPWTLMPNDTEIIAIDIPALGIEDACVSLTENGDATQGLIFFESLDDFGAFLEFIEELGPISEEESLDESSIQNGPRIPLLSVVYFDVAELPPSLQLELVAHRLPTTPDNRVPLIRRSVGDRTLQPYGEREVTVLTAISEALISFFSRYGESILDEDFQVDEEIEIQALPGKPKVFLSFAHSSEEYEEDEEDETGLFYEEPYQTFSAPFELTNEDPRLQRARELLKNIFEDYQRENAKKRHLKNGKP